MPKSKKITYNDFKKDFNIVVEKFKEDYPKKPIGKITRNYYRQHTKLSNAYEKEYETFSKFRKDMLSKEEIENIKKYDIEKKLITLEEENRELKRNNKELLKGSIIEDELIDIYRENLNVKRRFDINTKIIKSSSNKKMLLCISDIHLGEVVIAEQVNFVNEYNKDICVRRLNSIFDQVVNYAKVIDVNEINILLNGDLCSGSIHEELIRGSDLNEVESIFFLNDYFIEKFSELTKFFNKINVDIVVGNHARILQGRPYQKNKVKLNWEYILGQMLKSYFENTKNKKVDVHVPESAFFIKRVGGLKFLVTHGDIFAQGGGGFSGLPFYGLCMSAAKMNGVLQQIGVNEGTQFDHIIIGHYHTSSKIPIFNGGSLIINGCICGTNEFSLFKMKSVAKKEQTLLIINDDNIDGEITIKFD